MEGTAFGLAVCHLMLSSIFRNSNTVLNIAPSGSLSGVEGDVSVESYEHGGHSDESKNTEFSFMKKSAAKEAVCVDRSYSSFAIDPEPANIRKRRYTNCIPGMKAVSDHDVSRPISLVRFTTPAM